ncbi:hypothetical protein NEDG_01844 [Nematocida displodere]|uniref:Uncharacterized protein n=1 Tax=Nematocida displodere TaxID=1805483 RepID=A0A177EI19_9MICR|nr:hypothetical protein NEDG_01844 [Nematocida displodere]
MSKQFLILLEFILMMLSIASTNTEKTFQVLEGAISSVFCKFIFSGEEEDLEDVGMRTPGGGYQRPTRTASWHSKPPCTPRPKRSTSKAYNDGFRKESMHSQDQKPPSTSLDELGIAIRRNNTNFSDFNNVPRETLEEDIEINKKHINGFKEWFKNRVNAEAAILSNSDSMSQDKRSQARLDHLTNMVVIVDHICDYVAIASAYTVDDCCAFLDLMEEAASLIYRESMATVLEKYVGMVHNCIKCIIFFLTAEMDSINNLLWECPRYIEGDNKHVKKLKKLINQALSTFGATGSVFEGIKEFQKAAKLDDGHGNYETTPMITVTGTNLAPQVKKKCKQAISFARRKISNLTTAIMEIKEHKLTMVRKIEVYHAQACRVTGKYFGEVENNISEVLFRAKTIEDFLIYLNQKYGDSQIKRPYIIKATISSNMLKQAINLQYRIRAHGLESDAEAILCNMLKISPCTLTDLPTYFASIMSYKLITIFSFQCKKRKAFKYIEEFRTGLGRGLSSIYISEINQATKYWLNPTYHVSLEDREEAIESYIMQEGEKITKTIVKHLPKPVAKQNFIAKMVTGTMFPKQETTTDPVYNSICSRVKDSLGIYHPKNSDRGIGAQPESSGSESSLYTSSKTSEKQRKKTANAKYIKKNQMLLINSLAFHRRVKVLLSRHADTKDQHDKRIYQDMIVKECNFFSDMKILARVADLARRNGTNTSGWSQSTLCTLLNTHLQPNKSLTEEENNGLTCDDLDEIIRRNADRAPSRASSSCYSSWSQGIGGGSSSTVALRGMESGGKPSDFIKGRPSSFSGGRPSSYAPGTPQPSPRAPRRKLGTRNSYSLDNRKSYGYF